MIDNYQQLSAILIDTQVDAFAQVSGLNLKAGCDTTGSVFYLLFLGLKIRRTQRSYHQKILSLFIW